MNALNSTRARMFRRSLMALACAAAAAPVFAQSAAAPAGAASATETLQRVEVTGSRIKQIDLESASPVQVINSADIKRTGATSVREMLQTLTATSSNGSISDVNGSNSFSPGASQASLRNLGAQSTLVLLNGRRLPIFPLPNFQETFVNLDTIPLAAVERIEVLKVGGSAVYGSDAIAGVINVITKNAYNGIEVGGSNQASLQNGKFGERTATLTGGLGNYDKDGYNLFGTVEWFQRDSVFWTGNVLGSVNPAYGQVAGAFGSPSSYSYPGNLNLKQLQTGTPCTGPVTSSGRCNYDRYSRFQAVPAAHRVNALLAGDVKINNDTQWHTELQLSDVHVRYESAYQAYGFNQGPITWLDLSTGQAKSFYERGLPATNPLNPTGAYQGDFRYRFADSEAGESTHTTSYRLLTSLKGVVKDWNYNAAIGVMGGHAHDRSRGQFSESGFTSTIGDPGHLITDEEDPNAGSLTPVPADFFNKTGGYKIGQPNSAAVLNTLFPLYGFDGTYRQYFVDANVDTTIAELPAGALQLSLGAEARHESMVLTPTQNLKDSDIVGFSLSQSDGSRTFEALYGELSVPILKTMTAGLAGRLDKFPGFGAHFSPRANLEYRPVDIVKLRGTVETGFRAPNLQESSPSSKSAYQPGVTDPKRCPAATTLANQYRDLAAQDPANRDDYLALAEVIQDNECSTSVPIIAQNNPALKPETSISKSFGAVVQVSKHWSVHADYWNIERRNEINLKSVNDLLSQAGNDGPGGAVTRAPLNGISDPTFGPQDLIDLGVTAGPIASVKLQYGNLFKTRTSGIDMGLGGDIETPIGKLESVLDATYTSNYQAYSPTRYGTGGWGDNLAGRYGYPQWQLNLTNTLTVGSLAHTIRWVHSSGTSLQTDFNDSSYTLEDCPGKGLTADQCKLKAYNRFDYALEFTGIKNMTLGANITNVLGKRTPVDYRAFGGAGGIIPSDNEDAQRRLLKVYFNYKFI